MISTIILTELIKNLRSTGGSSSFKLFVPTTEAAMMRLPTSRKFLLLLRNKESVIKTALVILVQLLMLWTVLSKLLGRDIAAIGCWSDPPNITLLLSSPFEKFSDFTLNVAPGWLNTSVHICCADTANDVKAITTGTDVLVIGMFSRTDSTASSILQNI